ncbi:interleukin-22 [Arapaima gigas]
MKRIFLLTTMVFCSLQGNSAVGVIKHRNRARPGVRSPPLENVLTLQRVRNLAQAAQQLDDDTETRLIPAAQFAKKTNLFVCCLHANILDFYLWNLLTTEDRYPDLDKVRTELARVSRDLSQEGCSVVHVSDHDYSRKFREGFHQMGKPAVNKAMGEIDILFDSLSIFC